VKNTDFIPNAVLDANVLYPIHLRDFACWLQWHGAHRMVWSAQLGIELRRALNRSGFDPNLGNRVWRQLNQAFHDNLKELHSWTPLGLPDADDEHVAQLALQQCGVLVTFNQRDFPTKLIKPLEVRTPDDYFLNVVQNHPMRSIEAVRSMLLVRTKFPITEDQLLDALAQNRLPDTAEYLRRLSGSSE
jgi:hypothetical protein